MKETSAARDGGGPAAVCKVVASAGGDVDGKARHRRLELRRLEHVAEEPLVLAKRIRSGGGGRLSHDAVSVIDRRREMEDAFAVALSFLTSDPSSSSPGAKDVGKREQEQDFFAVYDGHGGARVAEACRERMHVVLAEEVGQRRGDLHREEAMAASFARVDGEVTGGFAPLHKPPPPQQQQHASADAEADAATGNLPYRTVGVLTRGPYTGK